jgi:hypothetical protein
MKATLIKLLLEVQITILLCHRGNPEKCHCIIYIEEGGLRTDAFAFAIKCNSGY